MKLHFYPNYEDKAVVKTNSDINRYYYNRWLTIDYYIADMFKVYGLKRLHYNPLLNQWLQDIRSLRKISVAKRQYYWLNNKRIDCTTPGRAFMNENQAKRNFYKGLQNHPVFHSKRKQGYYWTYQTSICTYKHKSGKRIWSIYIIDRKHVYVKGLGKVRTSKIPPRVWKVFKDNNLRLGTVTITKDNTNTFTLSFALGSEEPFIKVNKTGCKLAMLGYDLNLSNFLYASNGTEIGNPRYYEKQAEKLEWLQHKLSRKYRHNKSKVLSKCSNYQSNRRKLAKVAKHVYDQRHTFIGNISKMTVDNQDFIVGESLESSNMLRNHSLAKHIQSVGWREFISKLAEKANEYHKIYILINPANTTQRCSNCGYICNYKDKTHVKLGVEKWTCPRCHHVNIRDYNASRNILYNGILAIQKYLPKRLRLPISNPKHLTKKDMNILRISTTAHPAWLSYLVTHYCGVLDVSKPSVANLNTFHRTRETHKLPI